MSIAAEERAGLATIIARATEALFPGYFALVMATGVVSIASFLLGHEPFAQLLVWLNWLFYVALWALTFLRIIAFPSRIADDLFDHQRAPGFFTTVAGTCVLGTQSTIVANAPTIGLVLWWLGLGLWFVIMYAFLTAVTIRSSKPSLGDGINGAWLIAAVATQSIVILRGVLDGPYPPSPQVQLLSLAMFMVGTMIYLAIIPLIFYRLTFVRFESRDFSPPYWINMGAVAITTLAGSTLIALGNRWPVLAGFEPILRGFTVFCWAVATWWIPFLLALMVWRHVIRRDPIDYEPQLWGMVFPLGMYTTGTFQLSHALGFEFLVAVPKAFIFVAVIAWTATFFGLLHHLVQTIRGAPRQPG